MKKVLMLAALVLGMASCQRDFAPEANYGGEVDFTLAVSTPEFGVTRAGADGLINDGINGRNSAYGAIDYFSTEWDEVNLRYILEIYDAADDYTNAEPVKDRQVIVVDSYQEVTFQTRLVPGREYHFVVFADFVDQATGESLRHDVGNTLGQITIKNDKINDEYADAYFGSFDYTPANTGNEMQSLSLTRPYAKVRVVATDLAELNLNVDPGKVYVAYTAPNHIEFNAVNGTISKAESSTGFDSEYDDSVSKLNLSKHYYTAGYDALKDDKTGRHTHMTLFTDYILAKSEQTRINFTMAVEDKDGGEIKTVAFTTDIPVQRNYLTTIIGNVLTAATEIKVTIDDNFTNAGTPEERPFYQVAVSTGYEFVQAFYEDREIILQGPITVTEDDVNAYMATRAAAAINPIVNLNGFTLTFVNNGDNALLTVADGSSLTIVDEKGTGAIVLEGDGVAIENNGELNVVDTTIEANGEGSVIENNGEANIEGSTLNDGALANNGTANFNDTTVADGAVENDDDAIVGTYVYTAEELQAAINAAEVGLNNEVSFGENIAGNVTILQKEGVNLIINGRDFEFDGVITVNGGGRAKGNETLTFKAINFATEGSDFTFISAPSKIDGAYNYSHNVTIERCTFNGNQTVGSASFTGTYNFVMKNCKATNMHSILQLQSVDNKALVEEVETVNCKNGLSFGNTAYPTLKNSTIKASEYGVRADGDASRGALVLEGNTIEANVPVIVRKTTTKYDVTLVNNVITKGGLFEVVFTNGKDDEEYVAPTGTYTITGAEDYMVYPRNSVANWDEFVATTASKVVLLNDITYDANYQLQKNIVVDLNAKSMTLPMINIHKKVTIMNGTINGKVYARKDSEIVFNNVKFSGAVADNLSTEGHLAIQGGCKSLYAKDCLFSPTSVSGSQTKPLSFEGGSTIMKFEGCEFKSSPYKKQVYLNSLSATGSLDFTNCNFNNKTPNIMFAADCPLTNLTMSGTTKLSSVTLETNRAKDAVTAEDLAYLRESLIANNSMSSVRLFYAGGSSEYIR